MIDDNLKSHWLKLAAIIFMTFIISFLAFYIVMEIMLHRMSSPAYHAKQIERMIQKEQRELRKFEEKVLDNPFEPKMRPMIVNLVKEPNEYKVIVDLKPLDGNENSVQVQTNENALTISGELEKKLHGNEKIISFSQTYYLDETPELEKMTKEKKGEKFIITIPYED